MISIDDLHRQNHEIGELAKVLNHLFSDREMCDTAIACELFDRYRDKFDRHVKRNKHIYSLLLSDGGADGAKTAHRFISGEKEVKKVFRDYTEKWCKNGLHIFDHNTFLSDTEDMFRLVWDRIQAESEQLYPLARRLTEGEVEQVA
ncbi:MAG: hypothetical protein H6906_15815 [Hyphomicrobiales bacterium]|nr:hypothetical protein [Hyphomicrobiales bacterium]